MLARKCERASKQRTCTEVSVSQDVVVTALGDERNAPESDRSEPFVVHRGEAGKVDIRLPGKGPTKSSTYCLLLLTKMSS